MLRLVDGAGDDANAHKAVTPDAPPPPPAQTVTVLCRRIAARLPKQTASGDCVGDSRKHLACFAIQFSSPDDGGRGEYRWPGSRLTGDDMRKLHILSNRTGWPCTELIHVAVGLLFDETRDMVLHLLATQEQTGRTFTEVADEIPASVADVPDRPSQRRTSAGEAVHHPHPHVAPKHREDAHELIALDLVENTPVIAAESARASDSAHADTFPPHAMNPRKPADCSSGVTHEQLETVSEEVRRLRDEVCVLREAIDDFREAFEHTVRNLPDQLPPPLRVWSLPADPTAPDFGERINAVPPEQMEILRAEAKRCAPPTESPGSSGRQRRLFE